MSRRVAAPSGFGLIIALLLVGGCMPPPGAGDATQGENFLNAGTTRAQRDDFNGAVVAFEQALRADPGLADAHHKLAVLFDTQLNRPEKALYHYVRTLELQPAHKWADLISNRLGVVKMQLARDSVPAIPSPQLDKEIDRLELKVAESMAEQQRLFAENEELRKRLAAFSQAPVPVTPTNPSQRLPETGITDRTGPQSPGRTGGDAKPIIGTGSPPKLDQPGTAPRYITYQIQKGDSVYGLSRRHGLAQAELLAANPGLSVGNFPVGRTIKIPVK